MQTISIVTLTAGRSLGYHKGAVDASFDYENNRGYDSRMWMMTFRNENVKDILIIEKRAFRYQHTIITNS
ncbi:MAG: hypothetical protein WCF23_24180 [Candidatus Nitrosopolaris sp.]